VREVFGMIPVGIVSDNASAMARAIEDYEEDDDDDVAEAAMFTEEPPENEDEAEEEEGEAAFFVHVRSWSHVFQLLMGDVAKQLTTAVEVPRKVLHISRSTRDHVARLRIIAGKSTTKLIIPTSPVEFANSKCSAHPRFRLRVARSRRVDELLRESFCDLHRAPRLGYDEITKRSRKDRDCNCLAILVSRVFVLLFWGYSGILAERRIEHSVEDLKRKQPVAVS
jgi:hypothetical protein